MLSHFHLPIKHVRKSILITLQAQSTSLVYANVTIVMEFNFIAAVECEFVGAKKKENVEVEANN